MKATGKMGGESHLIPHRTPMELVQEEITVITRGGGVRVFDHHGRRYLDLVAGVTRPVHAGYGRKEMAQAIHDPITAPTSVLPRKRQESFSITATANRTRFSPSTAKGVLFGTLS